MIIFWGTRAGFSLVTMTNLGGLQFVEKKTAKVLSHGFELRGATAAIPVARSIMLWQHTKPFFNIDCQK